MPRSLAQLEAEEKAERKRAKRWLARNEDKLPPGEPPRERVRLPGESPEHTREARTVLLGDELLRVGEELGVVYDERRRFFPLQGEDAVFNEDSFIHSLRIEAALKALPESQQLLLEKHFLEGLTLVEMRRAGESRQAVHHRLARAKLAFQKSWAVHKDDVIQVSDEEREMLLRRSITVTSVDELSTLPPQRCLHGPSIRVCRWCSAEEREEEVCSCY